MLRTLLAIGLTVQGAFAHADVGINLYGASYHFDRDKARERGLTHEVNPGLGVRWRSNESVLFADAGFYRDSAAHTAKLAGAGALWHASEHLRLGAALALLKSETYNHDKAFIAPLPLVAFETRRATFNLVNLPKWRDVNPTNQVGFWVTFWLPN